MTVLRRAILDHLARHDGPLSVPALQEVLLGDGLTPNKTSLYRQLESLHSGGEVQEVLLDNSGVYYEVSASHHHHALCKLCATAICIAHAVAEKGVKHLEGIARKSGFAATDHHMVLYGICKSCQAK